jgi:hypothetical protein
LRDSVADLAAFVVGLRLAFPCSRALRLRLRFREEPEQGRPAGRIDLGAVMTDAGYLAIRPHPFDGAPPVVDAFLRNRRLILRAPGHRPMTIPAAGSALRHPEGRGTRTGFMDGLPWELVRRRRIPGTRILLAPSLLSGARRLKVNGEICGLGERLARALRVVQLCWPEGHREILLRTCMVVPVREKGLVSYSLASRPGISFINVFGKSILELADDLLHETAHHRLHDIEELAPLLRRGPDTEEVQAFASPWRGTRRPLHGLLHGTYTFLFRAELFARILSLSRRRPRLLGTVGGRQKQMWIRAELRREIEHLRGALRDLGGASRSGLLTAEGRSMLRAVRAGYARHHWRH